MMSWRAARHLRAYSVGAGVGVGETVGTYEMRVLPDRLLEVLNAVPRADEWHPVHQLLTAGDGPPAVCLLSSAEIRATPTTFCIATRSSTAATNLAARGWATV